MVEAVAARAAAGAAAGAMVVMAVDMVAAARVVVREVVKVAAARAAALEVEWAGRAVVHGAAAWAGERVAAAKAAAKVAATAPVSVEDVPVGAAAPVGGTVREDVSGLSASAPACRSDVAIALLLTRRHG